jgi:hypothetical protein
MNSFIYKFTKTLDGSSQKDRYEIYVHRKELIERLQNRLDICSAILIASTPYDLDRILRLQRFVDGLQLVMVLPDRDSDTIAKAHSFRPRFLTYVDGDFSEIISVLEKITDRFNQNQWKVDDVSMKRNIEAIHNLENPKDNRCLV